MQRETAQEVSALDPTSGYGLRLAFAHVDDAADTSVEFDATGGWSARYGEWETAPHLRVLTSGCAPQTLVTFISPIAPSLPAPRSSHYAIEARAEGRAIVCRRTPHERAVYEDLVLVNPQRLDTALRHGRWSNASMLYLRGLGPEGAT